MVGLVFRKRKQKQKNILASAACRPDYLQHHLLEPHMKKQPKKSKAIVNLDAAYFDDIEQAAFRFEAAAREEEMAGAGDPLEFTLLRK